MRSYQIRVRFLDQSGDFEGFTTYTKAASLASASARAEQLAAESRQPARVELVQLWA